MDSATALNELRAFVHPSKKSHIYLALDKLAIKNGNLNIIHQFSPSQDCVNNALINASTFKEIKFLFKLSREEASTSMQILAPSQEIINETFLKFVKNKDAVDSVQLLISNISDQQIINNAFSIASPEVIPILANNTIQPEQSVVDCKFAQYAVSSYNEHLIAILKAETIRPSSEVKRDALKKFREKKSWISIDGSGANKGEQKTINLLR